MEIYDYTQNFTVYYYGLIEKMTKVYNFFIKDYWVTQRANSISHMLHKDTTNSIEFIIHMLLTIFNKHNPLILNLISTKKQDDPNKRKMNKETNPKAKKTFWQVNDPLT